MFKIIIFLLLIVFVPVSFADSYPAVDQYYFTYSPYTHTSYTNDVGGLCSQIPSTTNTITSGSNHPTASCKVTDNTSGAVSYLSVNSGINKTCPSGGTLGSPAGVFSCNNVTACPAGQIRDAMGACYTPPVTCGADQYNDGSANGGQCLPIPDCNADQPLGRYFFDVTLKACATTNTVGTICISETQKYCPPIDDCKPAGYICTNQPAAVAAAQATRQAEIDAAKAKADAAKADIAAAAAAAAQASQAKEAAAAKAKADKEAAAAAVAAANASGVQSAIDSAIQAYSKFATDYIDSLARAVNSSAAATKAGDINGQAGTEVASIPASVPGNAVTHKNNVEGLIPGVTRALDDAVTGNGNGNGAGSGVGTKDSPSIDTSKLNKEETQKSIDTSLKGIKDTLGAPSAVESDTTMPDVDKGVRDVIQGVIDDVNGVDTSLGTNPAAAVGMTSSYWSYAQGTCFPHEFDMGKFGSVKLDRFCAIYDEHIRSLLVLVLGFYGVLHVWSYWASIIAMSI